MYPSSAGWAHDPTSHYRLAAAAGLLSVRQTRIGDASFAVAAQTVAWAVACAAGNVGGASRVGAVSVLAGWRNGGFATQPADCRLDGLAVLRWRAGVRADGDATRAALQDDLAGHCVFKGEVI